MLKNLKNLPIIAEEKVARVYSKSEEVSVLKPTYCEHCGHTSRPRKETLSLGLVESLKLMHAAVKSKKRNEFSFDHDVKWDYTRIANFQKLRYHGLIHHVKNFDGSIKSGYWLITTTGLEFLKNKKSIPKNVYVNENRIIAYGATQVRVSDFYSEFYPEEYWQKHFSLPFELNRPQMSLL